MKKKYKGIKDLLLGSQTDFQRQLIDFGAVGNYYSNANICNLVNGKCLPSDGFTYVLIARIVQQPIEVILKRYSLFDSEMKVPQVEGDW